MDARVRGRNPLSPPPPKQAGPSARTKPCGRGPCWSAQLRVHGGARASQQRGQSGPRIWGSFCRGETVRWRRAVLPSLPCDVFLSFVTTRPNSRFSDFFMYYTTSPVRFSFFPNTGRRTTGRTTDDGHRANRTPGTMVPLNLLFPLLATAAAATPGTQNCSEKFYSEQLVDHMNASSAHYTQVRAWTCGIGTPARRLATHCRLAHVALLCLRRTLQTRRAGLLLRGQRGCRG